MSDADIRGARPPFSATSPAPKSAALPAELREFLVELGIALQKHGIYPRGHPSLIPAAGGIVTRLKSLLGERAELSIGVGRYQLVLEGVATDAKHPMLRELAGRLHRHLLGAVSLRRGLEAEELAQVLRFLAAGGDPPGEPVGLLPWERLNPWPHVRLHPVTYERLDLIEGEAGAGAGGGASRAAQLWLDLARAAMATRDADESPPDSERVAQAINEHPAATAYDQAVIANLLQIAEALKAAQGADAVALRGRVSQLVTKLKPETLTRLLDMGGDRAQRRKFLLDSTEGLGVDAVLRLVDAAAVSSRQTISDSMLRLLSKLAVQADRGAAAARVVADTAVRSQVTRLIENWTLDDPNPEAYSAGLEALSRSARAQDDKALRGPLASPEPLRIVQMGLEVDAAGPALWDAVARLVSGRELEPLLDALERAPKDSKVAQEIWPQVATPDQVRILLQGDPFDFTLIDRLLVFVGTPVAGVMLEALAESASRATRRALIDRLAAMGPGIGEQVVARLEDDRWYVQRNFLALMDRMEAWPEGFSPAPYFGHSDPRVRREALKLLLRLPQERDWALATALGETDERILPIALAAAQRGCPAEGVPLILKRLSDGTLGDELRAAAVRALRHVRSPEVLDIVLGIASPGKSLFGRAKLASKSPEMLAALTVLAESWQNDARARDLLERAAASGDAEIQAAARAESARR